MRPRGFIGIALGVALSAASAGTASAQASSEARIALVIGNGSYPEAPLRNPANDARAMARMLRELGFTVVAQENATKRAMETAIVEFGRRLAEGGVGVFYYAGHGLQVRGRNYLVPIDAEIDSEAATRVAAVDVDLVLEQMTEAKNRVNVVILDACRNNPFERRMRGASRGLAAIDAARGTLISYATAPGSVAADGDGAHGLFTEELLRALQVPGLKIEEVFKQVRVGVTTRSKGAQTPWESSSLTGDLVVRAADGPAAPPAPLAAAAPGAASADRARPAATEARFDGLWHVAIECPRAGNAEGYVFQFFADVKDGALRGQYGTEGQPSSLILSGRIQADGSAELNARGLTGDPKFTANRESKGSAYAYRAKAQFDATRGSGKRTDVRPCDLTFVKQ